MGAVIVFMTLFPMALQMRFLQALAEVATENNSTIVFPLPLDLLKPFLTEKKTTETTG